MAKQEISRLGKTLERDVELRTRFEKAKDVEQLLAIARASGYDFTGEELGEALQSGSAEMSEDELQRVAGGSLNFTSELPAVQAFRWKLLTPMS